MGILLCFHSSNKRIAQKISLKLIKLTKSKPQFNKNLNLFVSYALKFDHRKAKILVDLIKIELTNTNLKAEKRYLYLTLLNRLIVNNVLFLKISHENNLLSYVAGLSDIKNKANFFHSGDKEESILLLCSLAISCLEKWFETYQNNEVSIEFLKKYKNEYQEISSYEISDVNMIRSNLIDNSESPINCDENPFSNEKEIDHFDHVNFSGIKISYDHQSNTSESIPKSAVSEASINVSESNLNKKIDQEICVFSSTEIVDKVDEKTQTEINQADTKEKFNNEKELNLTSKENRNENNGLDRIVKKPDAEQLNIINKYNTLKQKYLLLVQKNDYLQSRLDFYEDYNFYSKNLKKGNKDRAEIQVKLFKDLFDFVNLIDSKTFFCNFRKLISNNDWILFEDNVIQIGLKAHFEGSVGNLSIYLGNKLPVRLEDFSIELKNWNINPKVLKISRNDEKFLPCYIAGKQQICSDYIVKCNDIYTGTPVINVKFLLPDSSSKIIKLPLPIVLSKFSYETISDQKISVSKLWHSDIYLLSQASSHLDKKSTDLESISDIIERCKLGNTFKLYFEDDEHIGNANRIYLFGNILSHQVIIQVQVCDSISTRFTVRVRSDSAMLSSSILSILMFQLGEPLI